MATSQHDMTRSEALQLLARILSRILENEDEPRYRSLNMAAAALRRTLLALPGTRVGHLRPSFVSLTGGSADGLEIIKSAGFVEQEDGRMVLPPCVQTEHLCDMRAALLAAAECTQRSGLRHGCSNPEDQRRVGGEMAAIAGAEHHMARLLAAAKDRGSLRRALRRNASTLTSELIAAVEAMNISRVVLLLRSGARADKLGRLGGNALHMAAKRGAAAVAEELVHHPSASVNVSHLSA